MQRPSLVLAFVVVMLLAAPSHAGMDEGDWEVQLAGHWNAGDFQTSYGGLIALGYFVTPEIEVGGWLGYGETRYDSTVRRNGRKVASIDSTSADTTVAAFAAYYFEVDGEWMPYVGGFVGYENRRLELDDDSGDLTLKKDGFALGAFLGIKYFISDRSMIFTEYRLTWQNTDWEDDDLTVDEKQFNHSFLLGISILF